MSIDIQHEFEESGAFLTGHFILSSGLHSDSYVQCALALQDPERAYRLCSQLVHLLKTADCCFDCVLSPALGGLIVGYEVARITKNPFMFVERVGGVFTLRRGFHIPEGARCLIVEDVVTTGLSTRETIAVVHMHGGKVVAVASLIDRSKGKACFAVPYMSLLQPDINTYPPDDLPEGLKSMQAVKPGSRTFIPQETAY